MAGLVSGDDRRRRGERIESLHEHVAVVPRRRGGGRGVGHRAQRGRAGEVAVPLSVFEAELAAGVSDPAAVRRLVADVESTLGPIDLFVSNAGIGSGSGLDATADVNAVSFAGSPGGALAAGIALSSNTITSTTQASIENSTAESRGGDLKIVADSQQLATDMLRQIAAYSKGSGGCSMLFSAHMAVMPRSFVPQQPTRPAVALGGHYEIWTVNACAAKQRYQVAMWPSPRCSGCWPCRWRPRRRRRSPWHRPRLAMRNRACGPSSACATPASSPRTSTSRSVARS